MVSPSTLVRPVGLQRLDDAPTKRDGGRWMYLIAGVLAAQLVLLLWGIDRYPGPFDDEGTYLAQAWAVLTQGELSHYTYWYDHPPLGWLLLIPWLALTQAFDGIGVLIHGRVFMVLLAVLGSWLTYMIGRRLGMRRPFALLAVGFFAFSPLAIHYQRMVLLDNIALPLILGSFVLLLSPRRRLWEQQAGVVLFGLGVLCKETMLLLLPVVVILLYQGSDRANRRYSMALAASLFGSVLILYPLLAALKGELLPGPGHVSLFEALQWQLFDRPGGGVVWDTSSGKYATVMAWLSLDRWLPIAGVLSLPFALVLRPLRPLGVGLATLALALLRPGYVPSMFIIAALPLIALTLGGLFDFAWSGWNGRHSERRRFDRTRAARVASGTIAAPILLFALLPAWGTSIWEQVGRDETQPLDEAIQWVTHEVQPGTPILVDNVAWMELVAAGYPPSETIWYYKLDLDPAVAAEFPNGWQDFEYAISTPGMRATVYDLPTVTGFLQNSRIVESFDSPDSEGDEFLVEIRSRDYGAAHREVAEAPTQ